MKVLVLVSKAVLGGHIISAFTVARYLQKRGHTIIFAGGQGKLTERIATQFPFVEVDIPFYHGQRECYFTWKSLKVISPLRDIINKYDIDLVHAFDARVYIHGSLAALLEKIPITCTLCGGTDPLYNIPLASKMIVFSEEQRQKMLRQFNWNPDRVEVIRTRVDVDSIVTDNSASPMQLSLEEEVPVVMMISSFDNTKAESILQVMDALDLLIEQNISFQMVFIGGRGSFFEEMKERGTMINKKMKRQIILFTGPVVDAFKLLRKATIVLGVGRSAFEGMAYAKPTIIVGANGFAGVVTEQTVDDIAFYNFSGRNQKKPSPPRRLAKKLVDLLTDEGMNKSVGHFGQTFVFEEIDVKVGLSRIEDVYQLNLEGNKFVFRIRQWVSLCRIMIPIWRDNLWHTIGIPLKRILGKDVHLDENQDKQG